MSAPTVARDVKAALVTVCRNLWPAPVAVTYGPLGTDEPDDTAEILDVSFTENEARMAPLRRRWFDATITGRITCYRGGGVEAVQTASEAALVMLGQLSDYLQDSGVSGSTQVTLGNLVQWARVSSFDLTEEPDDIEHGRISFVDFEVTALVLV